MMSYCMNEICNYEIEFIYWWGGEEKKGVGGFLLVVFKLNCLEVRLLVFVKEGILDNIVGRERKS